MKGTLKKPEVLIKGLKESRRKRLLDCSRKATKIHQRLNFAGTSFL